MAAMFFLSYVSAELRRRRGRTLLTALGLAVGVGLVATVTALSEGLDDAQSKVLEPLTGVGTDMSVSRPARGAEDARGEHQGGTVRLDELGKPGEKFTREDFFSSQRSFPQGEVGRAAAIDGVAGAAGSLTLNLVRISGEVPEAPPDGGGVSREAPAAPSHSPDELDFQPSTITGVDTARPDLAPVTPERVVSGSWFTRGGKRELVLSASYARQRGLRVGESVELKGRRYEVVGLSRQPLGGQSADMYVRLDELQKMSGRRNRVNGIQIRARSGDEVEGIAKSIESEFQGAQVTTAKDLADRVSGSLVHAKDMAGKMGTALSVVGLVAAFLIAALLTLSSVNKRVRELGTLKAIGWPQRLVVRQVTGESLVQGLLGGVLGAALGIGGAALITAFGPELQATVEGPAGGGGPGPPGPRPGPALLDQGQSQVESGTSTITLGAPIDPKLILLAIGLALVGGLVSGAIGGARVARLRPADALRSVE